MPLSSQQIIHIRYFVVGNVVHIFGVKYHTPITWFLLSTGLPCELGTEEIQSVLINLCSWCGNPYPKKYLAVRTLVIRVISFFHTAIVMPPKVWNVMDSSNYDEFTCKPRDTVRYNFTLAWRGKQPVRSVTTSGSEIKTLCKGDWKEHVRPIGLFSTLYINAWVVKRTWTCSYSVMVSLLTLFT